MTEAQVISLTAALRTSGIAHEVREVAPDDWLIMATSGTLYTAAQLTNLETTHGVVARTNRAEFR